MYCLTEESLRVCGGCFSPSPPSSTYRKVSNSKGKGRRGREWVGSGNEPSPQWNFLGDRREGGREGVKMNSAALAYSSSSFSARRAKAELEEERKMYWKIRFEMRLCILRDL